MKNKRTLLIKTFFKASGSRNILKYTNDKKKRSSIIANTVAYGFLYILLAGYCTLMSWGMQEYGMAKDIAGVAGMFISAISFLFTLLKSNGYLFGFKEFDMIMSMPFSAKDIVSAKFLYMYLKGLPMQLVITLSMLIGYAASGEARIINIVLWIVLAFFVPVLPTLLASAIGALIVRVGVRFKYKKQLQSLFMFIVFIPLFFSRYIIEGLIKEEETEELVGMVAGGVSGGVDYLPNVLWFSKAVNDGSMLYAVILIVVSVAAYELLFRLLSPSYRRVNSALTSGGSHVKYTVTDMKRRDMAWSVAYKEYKRMTGSSTYFTNAAFGEVIILILGVAALFVKAETIVSTIMSGAPLTPSDVETAIPILIYMFAGMVPTTCCSPSLEGKNYWIMKTLPIAPMTDCKGKMLFNLILSVPISVFATISLCFCFRTSVINTVMATALIIALCCLSTVRGMKCGLKHRNLNWDNEIEVIKQGSAVTSYMIPNIIITIIMLPMIVVINILLGNTVLTYAAVLAVVLILTALSWMGFKRQLKNC